MYGLSPGWKIVCKQVPSIIYFRSDGKWKRGHSSILLFIIPKKIINTNTPIYYSIFLLFAVAKTTFCFEFLQTPLIIKVRIKYENKFNRKVFTNKKHLKFDFQNFHVLWKGTKSTPRTFLGSIHRETILKYVFYEML